MKKPILGFLSALALLSCNGGQQHSIELQSEADLSGLRALAFTLFCELPFHAGRSKGKNKKQDGFHIKLCCKQQNSSSAAQKRAVKILS